MTGTRAGSADGAGAGSASDGGALGRPTRAPHQPRKGAHSVANSRGHRPARCGPATTSASVRGHKLGRHSASVATPGRPSAATSANTIEDDMKNSFQYEANECRRGLQARRRRTSPRGLARSLKQRKESRRPQSNRRDDHASAQRRHGQGKEHDQSHVATEAHSASPGGHGGQATLAGARGRTRDGRRTPARHGAGSRGGNGRRNSRVRGPCEALCELQQAGGAGQGGQHPGERATTGGRERVSAVDG